MTIITAAGVERRIPMQRPRPAEKFTDREEELAECVAALAPGRVVTLVGPGGIGKTAIAAEAVWRLAPHEEAPQAFPDGMLFHSFYNRPEASAALEHLAESFGEAEKGEPQARARRALGGRRALVVLDGTEETDDLRAVLDVCGSCGVLVTTRRRRDAVGEMVEVEPLPHAETVALMREWAGVLAEDEETIERICDVLGNLPLAVQLTGRYLREQNIDARDYAAWLEETPLAAMDFGARRERSVPLLVEGSLAQVGNAAGDIVAVAGQLALAPFPRELMAAALDMGENEIRFPIGELVDYGLLLKEDNGYQLGHALIHTYARRRLSVSGEVLGRVAGRFTRWWTGPPEDDPEGCSLMMEMRPHLIAVLRALEKRGSWQVIEEVTVAVDDYLDVMGYATERLATSEVALRAARGREDRPREASWLEKLGTAYRHLGQLGNAIDYYKQALVIAREIGDRGGEGSALDNLGTAHRQLGQAERAVEYHQQALVIARQIGDYQNEGIDLGNLGLAYADLGQVERAIECYEQALDIAQDIGNRRSESMRLSNLGNAYSDLGQVKRAAEFYRQALAISHEIGDRRGEGSDLGNLGNAYRHLGQAEQAIVYYEQSLAIARELGGRRAEATDLGNLGLAYRELGKVEQAVEYHEEALAISRAIGDRRGEGNHLGNLGIAHAILGQTELAIEYYEEALAISRDIGNRRGEGADLGNLGLAYADLGQVERAIAYYQQALVIAREVGDRRNEGNHLANLGVAYGTLGKSAEARIYSEKALAIFEEISAPDAEWVRERLQQLNSDG